MVLPLISKIAAFASLTVVLLAGCSGGGSGNNRPTGSVSGKVTLSGQPVTGGAVHFTSTKIASEAFGADLSSTGDFKVGANIPAGSYKVTLSPPPVGPSIGPDGQMRPADPKATQNAVPAKYRTPEKSDKTVEVKTGSNTLTIELTP